MNLYHALYDTLYEGYDYDIDLQVLIELCLFHEIRFDSILEVGCGTGKHTSLLAKYFKHVMAIDNDPQMIEKARDRLLLQDVHNVSLIYRSALDLTNGESPSCNIACSLFNVVNYVTDKESLGLFFQGIASALKPQGFYVFDCLDSSKNYTEKFVSNKTYDLDGLQCICDTETTYDQENKKLSVLETYLISNRSHAYYQQSYKMWDPKELIEAAENSGFDLLFYKKKKEIHSLYTKENQIFMVFKKREKSH